MRRQRRRVADPASDLRPRHRRPPGECLLGVGRAADHHDRERLGAGRHRDRRHGHLRIHEGSPSQRVVRRHAAAPHRRERRHLRVVDPVRERGDRALPEDRRRSHLRRQVEEHDPRHRPHRPASRRHRSERVAVGPAGVGRLAQPVPAGEPHRRRGRRRSGRCDRVAPRRRDRPRLRLGRRPVRDPARHDGLLRHARHEPGGARRRIPHARRRGRRRRRRELRRRRSRSRSTPTLPPRSR